VALVLIPALATLGNLSWTTSILLGAPLAMISLFIPIDAAYICRFAPLGKAQMWRIILTHLAARASAELALDADRGSVFAGTCIHSALHGSTNNSLPIAGSFIDGLFVLCVFRGISLCCDGAGRGARVEMQ